MGFNKKRRYGLGKSCKYTFENLKNKAMKEYNGFSMGVGTKHNTDGTSEEVFFLCPKEYCLKKASISCFDYYDTDDKSTISIRNVVNVSEDGKITRNSNEGLNLTLQVYWVKWTGL